LCGCISRVPGIVVAARLSGTAEWDGWVNGAGNRQFKITIETALDRDTAEVYYQLYLTAFGGLKVRAAARQVLHCHEFMDEMADPRVWKYVAWSEDGHPVGLSTLTRHLETIPWISAEYFAEKYPEHARRDAIYYLGFSLVSAPQRRSRIFDDMISTVVERLVEDRAVCGYDICAHNDQALRLGRHIESILRRRAEVCVEADRKSVV
jgi:hypothetical protein